VTLSPAVVACGDGGDGGLRMRRQTTFSWPQRLGGAEGVVGGVGERGSN